MAEGRDEGPFATPHGHKYTINEDEERVNEELESSIRRAKELSISDDDSGWTGQSKPKTPRLRECWSEPLETQGVGMLTRDVGKTRPLPKVQVTCRDVTREPVQSDRTHKECGGERW